MLNVVSNSSSSSPSSRRELLLDLVVVLETALLVPLLAIALLVFAVAEELRDVVEPVVDDRFLPPLLLPLDLRGTQ